MVTATATATTELSPEIRAACKQNWPKFKARAVDAWRYREPPDIVEWIEDTLRFGRGRGVQLESRVGPFVFSDRPWWKFPLRCIANRRCNKVVMPAATQIGKTVNLDVAAMLYFAEFQPAPGMAILPDENEARLFRNRVYSIVEESAKFTKFDRIQIPTQRNWNIQEINLGSMLVHLAWAGSKQRTRGKPCWYVWFVECDVYRDRDRKAGDPVEAGKQRTKDVFRYKHIFESSPSENPSTVCDEEASCDVIFRWHGQCPHCGLWQELRFFPQRQGELAGKGGIVGLTTDEGEFLTPKQARRKALYRCLNGCEIRDEHKGNFVERGRWGPVGWSGAEPPELDPPRSAGFSLWAVHSPNETFGSIAEEYLIARRNGKLVDFWGNRLGRSYEHETKTPSWHQLGRRAAASHARRTVPDKAWFLTAGVDIQGENYGVRYVIRGWAPNRTSWLIDWGWVDRKPGDENDVIKSDMLEMERLVLQSDFPVVDEDNRPAVSPFDKQWMRVKLANVDSNYLPKKVHDWLRSLPEAWVDRLAGDSLLAGRVRAIRGDHQIKTDTRYRHSLVEQNTRTGEKYEGGLHQWGLAVYPYYDLLTEHISSEPGRDGSWYLTTDILGQGREYLEQVTNFHYVVEVDPKKGKKGVWKPKNHRIPVDFWDCEIYAEAAAEMVVGSLGWEQSAWEDWRESVKPKEKRERKTRTRKAAEIGAR